VLTFERKQIPPDIVVLDVAGKLVLGRDSKELEWAVDDLVSHKSTRVILDLADVTYMDSAGLGILVMCSSKLNNAGGEMRVGGATFMVDEVLKRTRVNKIIPCYSTFEQAAQSMIDT
jgi:anti-anti-sigma factor